MNQINSRKGETDLQNFKIYRKVLQILNHFQGRDHDKGIDNKNFNLMMKQKNKSRKLTRLILKKINKILINNKVNY